MKRILTTGNFRLSLGYQVLLAILLGVFTGIFLGPIATIFDPVGSVYIMLLQMVALPYICFTLIHGLGSMTPEMGKRLFKKGWPFWIMLWATIFLVIYLASTLIPKPMVAFIGNGSLKRDSGFAKNFLSYLVPENPFYDLVNNIVPAIAIFGLITGIALMHLPKKEPLLSILERANQTIEKILKWIAIFSPIGIFAHIAVATGTVYFEDLLSIEFYIIAFVLICLLMVFWILPIILSSFTPLSYKDALKAFKTVCILPFATAVPTIALPFIILYMQRLGEKHAHGDPNFHATSQTVMPFCYSFGQIGNCLILFYIFFLSFYYRHPYTVLDKTLLSVLTIPLSVGSSATSINAVSFLIDQLMYPQEAIQLFTETMAITLNFQVLLSTASVTTFIILVLYAYYDLLKVQWKKLTTHLFSFFALLVVLVFSSKPFIHLTDNYQELYQTLRVSDVIDDPVSSKILTRGEGGAPRSFTGDPWAEPLSEILKTGVLKVGFDPTTIPYCYYGESQELLGYDIAFAYQLARDLDCTLEFVPLDITKLGEELQSGKYDLAMSAIIMDEERLKDMDFSHPYAEQDSVLIVPLKEHSLFAKLRKVQETPNLRFGAVGAFVSVLHRHFPLATHVLSDNILKGFQEKGVDAWIEARSTGFAWCLSHPDYVVADYGGLIGKRYFAYPIRDEALDWASFLNNWLILKDQDGFKKRMERYWIGGENPDIRPPRWSILQNVLHWTN